MIRTLRSRGRAGAQRRSFIPADAAPAEPATAQTLILPAAIVDLDDMPLMGRAPWRPTPYRPRHGTPLAW